MTHHTDTMLTFGQVDAHGPHVQLAPPLVEGAALEARHQDSCMAKHTPDPLSKRMAGILPLAISIT
jgi:hypothetical protein